MTDHSEPTTAAGRCQTWGAYSGRRCALQQGHEGHHFLEGVIGEPPDMAEARQPDSDPPLHGRIVGPPDTLGYECGTADLDCGRSGCPIHLPRRNPPSDPPALLLTREDRKRLVRAGWFPWGDNAWIHEDDEGTVVDSATALAALPSNVSEPICADCGLERHHWSHGKRAARLGHPFVGAQP